MHAYMHGIFGAQMIHLFDLDNDDIDLSILFEKPKKKEPPQESTENGQQKREASDGTVIKKGDGETAEQKKENFDAN